MANLTVQFIAHLWSNIPNYPYKPLDGLSAGQCQCNSKSFVSYYTTIAQWLDKDKKILGVLDKADTPATQSHLNTLLQEIPLGTTVIRYGITDPNNHRTAWVLGFGESEFTTEHRVQITDSLLIRLYNQLHSISKGRSPKHSEIDLQPLFDIRYLNRLYNENLIDSWLHSHHTTQHPSVHKESIKRMAQALLYLDDPYDTVHLVDATFGTGTWDAYEKRVEKYNQRA